MPQGRDLVCFSNDWQGDPLSKHHLMRLAARDHRVLWADSLGNRAARATAGDARRMVKKLSLAVKGVRAAERNLWTLSPLAVPLPGAAWARELNTVLVSGQVRAAMRRLDFRDPIAIAYLPTAAPVVDHVDATTIVYHCVDDFPSFAGAGPAIDRLERELVAKSDLVIAASKPLADRLSRLHPRVELVRHGVDHAHFSRVLDDALPVHPLVRDLPRPIVGFVGLVEAWVDLDVLDAIARHVRGTVVVVGREAVDTAVLRARPNVRFAGRRPYAELPSLLKAFDVAVCPFREGRLAHAANPLKLREYLSAGLPVVSSPMPEAAQLPHVRIASGPGAFVRAVDACLADGPGPRRERSEAMRHESWEARWETIRALIDQCSAPGWTPMTRPA
jgi:glycosyltransferase involved in cell wall biosynthesis